MSKLVFIVEDDIVQQKMLAKHFKDMVGDFSVRTFIDPEDMISHLDEKPFAVVLDHYFGNTTSKTGVDYLNRIRKQYPKIPVIYHTSSADKALKDEVMSLGAVEFIYKDMASFVRLRTTLDELERKRVEREKGGFLKRLFKL